MMREDNNEEQHCHCAQRFFQRSAYPRCCCRKHPLMLIVRIVFKREPCITCWELCPQKEHQCSKAWKQVNTLYDRQHRLPHYHSNNFCL